MLRRVPVRPAEHEAPVGPLRERRPHLLTGDHPLVAVALGAGLHVGEVGAGVRLGVALAPDLGAGEDPGEEPALLLVGAEVDDGRPEKPLADDPDAPRALRSRVLLVEDDLLREREAAAAELLGPPDPDPPGLTERALPGGALVEQLVLVARPTAPAHRRRTRRSRRSVSQSRASRRNASSSAENRRSIDAALLIAGAYRRDGVVTMRRDA